MIHPALLFPALLYPLWEATNVQVTQVDLRLPRLSPELDPLSICLLTDLHSERWGRRERMLLKRVEGLQVDLLLLGGDQSRTLAGMGHAVRILSAIHPTYGAYAILGNAEHKRNAPTERLICRLEEAGVRVLRNQHATASVRGEPVHILGVDDPSKDRDDLALASRGLPEDGLRILLSHTPEGISGLGETQVDLVLSGHTHGGQLRFPGLGALYTHSHRGMDLDMGHFNGTHLRQYNPAIAPYTQLYISRGIGTAVLPIRFLAPPEVAVLHLRRGQPTD